MCGKTGALNMSFITIDEAIRYDAGLEPEIKLCTSIFTVKHPVPGHPKLEKWLQHRVAIRKTVEANNSQRTARERPSNRKHILVSAVVHLGSHPRVLLYSFR